jgi:hypothetical protein
MFSLTLEQAKAKLAQMESWDNDANNIRFVSLAPWLDGHKSENNGT